MIGDGTPGRALHMTHLGGLTLAAQLLPDHRPVHNSTAKALLKTTYLRARSHRPIVGSQYGLTDVAYVLSDAGRAWLEENP